MFFFSLCNMIPARKEVIDRNNPYEILFCLIRRNPNIKVINDMI